MDLATYRNIHRDANAARKAGKPIDTIALLRKHNTKPDTQPKTAEQWLRWSKAESAARLARMEAK